MSLNWSQMADGSFHCLHGEICPMPGDVFIPPKPPRWLVLIDEDLEGRRRAVEFPTLESAKEYAEHRIKELTTP